MKVIVYSTPTCMYCNALKAWLEENGIAFEERDLSDPAVAFRSTQELGYEIASVPITKIGDDVIVGFDRAKIKKALKDNA